MSQISSLTVCVVSTPRPCLGTLLCELKGEKFDDLIVEIGHSNLPKGRNVAWRKAKTSHVLFIDDDLKLAPGAIAAGREEFNSLVNCDYAQSKVVGGVTNAPDKFVGAVQWWSVDALKQLDGFDEDFPFFNEDLVMGEMASQIGLVRGYLESSMFFHYQLGNFEKLMEGNKKLKAKHPELYKKVQQEIR